MGQEAVHCASEFHTKLKFFLKKKPMQLSDFIRIIHVNINNIFF